MTTADTLKTEPKARSARDKAQVTNTIAYQIIDAEAAARREKTARLRALRQQQETIPLPDKSAAPAKRKRVTTRKQKT